MRRTNVSAAGLLSVALMILAGCGDGEPDGTEGTGDLSLSPATTTVPGSTTTLAKPRVSIPEAIPTELEITDIETGTGPKAGDGDRLVVHYVGVRSEDGTEFDNSYEAGQPLPVTLGAGDVIEGWDQGLVGIQAGGVRQLDIPAELAYEDQGSGEVIKPGDAISFVIEALAVIPPTTPEDAPDPSELDIESSTGATEVTTTDAVVGRGPEIEEGQTLELHLIALRGDDLQQLDSTWAGQPAQLQYTRSGTTLAGLYEGLDGMRVGGRRVIVVPADKAFGPEGNSQISLPPDTDLILIVDLFAAY